MKSQRQHYSSLFKAQVALEVLEKGSSFEDVSERFHVPISLIKAWVEMVLEEDS